ncbi:hypothetical protein [Variovorax sp. VRV01]|uniref:hypothetical protein n=1 Tax=Variovorax sp. VRV01 TaxID=2769259 RepID=UPI001CE092D2|nr:hypothetical protein [Variovorax sp. VRV01]
MKVQETAMRYEPKRIGVHKGWERFWRTACKGSDGELASVHDANRKAKLIEFVETGAISVPEEFRHQKLPSVNPPFTRWEGTDLSISLRGYANEKELSFERMMNEGRPDLSLAGNVFAAYYLSQIGRLHTEIWFPTRFGRRFNDLSAFDIPYTALGMVLDAQPRAEKLALAQLAAYRDGRFSDAVYYPIFIYIFRILASYFDQPDIDVTGDAQKDEVTQALFALWRTPDANQLVDVCLDTLDQHTHRCHVGDARHFYEFEDCHWIRLPIEIWLTFCLREKLGLQNPVLDHPLMPKMDYRELRQVGWRPSALIQRVYDRMLQEGMDEDQVLSGIMANG